MKKTRATTLLLLLLLAAGLSLLLYPTFSGWWNALHQSRAITAYADAVADMDDAEYQRLWNDAVAYNRALAQHPFHLNPEGGEEAPYRKLLDVNGTGIMGYIEIPSLSCLLPIYHGTDEGVLQIAVGHVPGSSLPVGGKSTHCVLSGHRGLPSARLFTDIDRLAEGDRFTLRTLDEALTYEVDQILTVLPQETDALRIQPGEDLCTLVTCTPYGVNSHRLLVRGHRIRTEDDLGFRVTADAVRVEPVLVAPIGAAPWLLALVLLLLTKPFDRKRTHNTNEKGGFCL